MAGSTFGFDDLGARPSLERLVRDAIERATAPKGAVTDAQWDSWILVKLIAGARSGEPWASAVGTSDEEYRRIFGPPPSGWVPFTLPELVAGSRKYDRYCPCGLYLDALADAGDGCCVACSESAHIPIPRRDRGGSVRLSPLHRRRPE